MSKRSEQMSKRSSKRRNRCVGPNGGARAGDSHFDPFAPFAHHAPCNQKTKVFRAAPRANAEQTLSKRAPPCQTEQPEQTEQTEQTHTPPPPPDGGFHLVGAYEPDAQLREAIEAYRRRRIAEIDAKIAEARKVTTTESPVNSPEGFSEEAVRATDATAGFMVGLDPAEREGMLADVRAFLMASGATPARADAYVREIRRRHDRLASERATLRG